MATRRAKKPQAIPEIPERDDTFLDARNLLQYIMRERVDGSPEPTERQYDVCDAMQTAAWKVVFGEDREGYEPLPNHSQIIVEAPRGEGKSLIAQVIVCWALYWNPHLNVFTASASEGFAGQFSTAVLSYIRTLEPLTWLTPLDGGRESVLKFDVSCANVGQHPSMKALGISGQLAGCRGDLIVVDDVETDENSRTDQEREKGLSRMSEIAAIHSGKPKSATILLGTPHTEESIYNRLTDRGYRRFIWPARYPDKAWMDANDGKTGRELAPMLAARMKADPSLMGPVMRENPPTDPVRMGEEFLQALEIQMGRSAFAMQMLLNTELADENRYALKLRDGIVTDFGAEGAPLGLQWSNAPENMFIDVPNMGLPGDRLYRPSIVGAEIGRFENGIMTIDPAGLGNDMTGLCVTRMMGGFIFVPYIGGFFGGHTPANLKRICLLAKKHGVKKLVPENNWGGGMYAALLLAAVKEHYPECSVEGIDSAGQKECRIIDTLEPVLNAHRIVFSAQALVEEMKPLPGLSKEREKPYRFQHQLTRITRDPKCLAHDDLVDSFAMGVQFWAPHMAVTLSQSQQNVQAKNFEEQVNEWYRRAGKSAWPDRQRGVPRAGHSRVTSGYLQRNRQ